MALVSEAMLARIRGYQTVIPTREWLDQLYLILKHTASMKGYFTLISTDQGTKILAEKALFKYIQIPVQVIGKPLGHIEVVSYDTAGEIYQIDCYYPDIPETTAKGGEDDRELVYVLENTLTSGYNTKRRKREVDERQETDDFLWKSNAHIRCVSKYIGERSLPERMKNLLNLDPFFEVSETLENGCNLRTNGWLEKYGARTLNHLLGEDEEGLNNVRKVTARVFSKAGYNEEGSHHLRYNPFANPFINSHTNKRSSRWMIICDYEGNVLHWSGRILFVTDYRNYKDVCIDGESADHLERVAAKNKNILLFFVSGRDTLVLSGNKHAAVLRVTADASATIDRWTRIF